MNVGTLFFLIEEITVVTEVFGHLDHFFSNREIPVLILDNHLLVRLLPAVIVGEKYACQGQYAVFVGSVCIGRVRNIQHAEFEPFLLPVRLRRIIVIFRRCIGRSRTMPRRPIVHILPETKVVLSKLVRISCIFDERITVIAAYVGHFYVRIQVGLSLCSGKRVDSLLQRYEGSQHLCIAVRLRAPVQNLTASVTVHARLVYSMRCFACEWPSISGLYLKRSACCNQTSNQQHCSKF
ncbi:hypothetical protein D3C73_784060 [compost metagenome]